jgi:hypothetical protein
VGSSDGAAVSTLCAGTSDGAAVSALCAGSSDGAAVFTLCAGSSDGAAALSSSIAAPIIPITTNATITQNHHFLKKRLFHRSFSF